MGFRHGRGGFGNTAADFATTVAGGQSNTASDLAATVAGGEGNTASGLYSIAAGGQNNTASNRAATVTGGEGNIASGVLSVVAGGYSNLASAHFSTIPGGSSNTVAGAFGFAAGNRAKALHQGAFVWADSTDADFASTAGNQFLIRATGGVGIGTNAPTNRLSVAGNADFSGNVGVGVSAPTVRLHVRGEGPVLNLEGASHAYVQYFPFGAFNGRKAFMGFPGSGSTEFTISNEIAGGFLNLSATNVRVLGTFINNSDARDKHDVREIDDALTLVENLRGVRYVWNERSIGGEALPKGEQIGFVAQDVEKVLPQAVATDTGGRKGVSYVSLVPVLAEAIKQQQARFDAELAKRDAENTQLKARLTALEAAILKMKGDK